MFLLFWLFQMICTRLNSNVSCRWHQQSVRQDVVNQQIGPLTVRAPSALDPGSDCQSSPTVGVVVDQNLPTLLGSSTTNAIQRYPSNGVDVDEHHHQAANQHAPRQHLESLTSINQCDISKRNKKL